MLNSSPETSIAVIDLNVAIWTVLPMLSGTDNTRHLRDLINSRLRLVAPSIWLAESVSAIRTTVYTRRISHERGREALVDLLSLGIDVIPASDQQCRSAYEWARRLGQSKCYDAFYLALAEELSAEFWTADRRLVNAARREGATWIHWIDEDAP